MNTETTQRGGLSTRFASLLHYLGLSAVDFSHEIGDERSEKLRRILDGNGGPSVEMLERIKKAFPAVDLNWLVTGEGTMISEIIEEGGRRQIIVKAHPRSSVIPFVSASEALNYPAHAGDPIYISSLPVLEDLRYNDAIFRDFAVTGAEMSPELHPGDVVRGFWTDPGEFEPFMTIGPSVVVLEDRITIMILKTLEEGAVSMSPLRKLFPPVVINLVNIRELWVISEIRKAPSF